MKGPGSAQGSKNCPNYLMIDPTMVGDEENLGFIDALKSSISVLILPEKTWKGMKTVFLEFKFLHIFQNFRNLAWR